MTIKHISVDFDDPKDLKKNISLLQKQRRAVLRTLGYVQITFGSSKRSVQEIYPIFDSVYDSDISSLFVGDQEKKYYTYVHCDPRKPLNIHSDIRDLWLASTFGLEYRPFYVGKGNDNRWMDFQRNEGHRKVRTAIRKTQKEIQPVIIKNNISEQEALILEAKIIDLLGLRLLDPNGYLVNLDESINPTIRRNMYRKVPNIRAYFSKLGFK